MLARPDVEHGEPIVRQIAAPSRVILGNVTRDIGKLERKAKVAGPVERCIVICWYAHNDSHHHANRACNMIAILIQVAFAARMPVGGIEREAFDNILRHAMGNAAFAGDYTKAVKGWLACGRSCQSHGSQFANRLQPLLRIGHCLHRAAMVLPVGHVITFAAPCVEQPDALTCDAIKQAAGETERF